MREVIGYEWCVFSGYVAVSDCFNTPAEAQAYLMKAKEDFPAWQDELNVRKARVVRVTMEEREWL